MAFENTLKAISSYNEILRANKLVDEGHLTFVLQTMFAEIQNEVLTGSTSLPAGGVPGQVLTKTTDDEGGVVWADSSSGGDFLPLTGGTMVGDIDFQYNQNIIGVNDITGGSSQFQTLQVNTINVSNLRDTIGSDVMSFINGSTILKNLVEYQNDGNNIFGIPAYTDFTVVHKKYIDDLYNNLNTRLTTLEP